MIKILIADDHVLFREGMESLLKNHTDFEIAGSASDGREAVAMARSLQPDLVLMDVTMPNLNAVFSAGLVVWWLIAFAKARRGA